MKPRSLSGTKRKLGKQEHITANITPGRGHIYNKLESEGKIPFIGG